MTAQEKDRIECAIRHIQTAVDVDPWAAEIAVEAMKRQIPKRVADGKSCPNCGKDMWMEEYKFCPDCGQKIDYGDD